MQSIKLLVVYMPAESGDKSNLEFLPWYNLPRIMGLHNAVSQHNLGTTNTDLFLLLSEKEPTDPLMDSRDRYIFNP